MAIEINDKVSKPEIYLVGDTISQDGVVSEISRRIDYARTLPPASTTTITGVSQFDQDNILTFQDSVRVIITGQMGKKPNYVRKGSELSSSLDFEGNAMFDTEGDNKELINYYAETWYTYDGTNPIRTRSRFYNFKDMDDFKNPNDPSGNPINNNINTLGFVLRTIPTGSDLVTIKAKTYYQGGESSIAIAIFKIALGQGPPNREFYQTPQ